MRCAGLVDAPLASSAITPQEDSAVCAIRGAKEAPTDTERTLLLVFTKRLRAVFTDECDRFPRGTGFSGGTHVPARSKASDSPVSHPLERHLTCALKT